MVNPAIHGFGRPGTTCDAFRHLPELSGKSLPAGESALRATDEVLTSWDTQARLLGLGPDWRLS